ncbi:receiver/sensor box histidine kinase [Natronomonas pharaonis DSM 2160]|uniref:histidine kinase n=1 Tax=Natronomonas pharaonis (strain ATCC 35678 / DSM 2160 / CIP 103997 / JCM 8858 / NBRC 14720 / NCIMB 2260 / Gabara) TaxID=348780 RepID=A0A1U7ETZ2_NATPD|nr:PAS domain-containing protein [Natronomonas pharaonis]CAI48402.1 receiver/sensor box histidine kinase [Natronomonas pharaonis DSM 2160]
MTDPVRVLHVDDEPGFAPLTAEFLEREHAAIEAETTTDPAVALDRLAESTFDCVIADYAMGGWDGIELLRAVRNRYPDLPFVLFTGEGSEDIASRAVAAGVTEYIPKRESADRYELLANRVLKAAREYQPDDEHEPQREGHTRRRDDLLQKTQEIAGIGAWEYDVRRDVLYWTDQTAVLHGVSPEYDPTLSDAIELYHPDDRAKLRDVMRSAIDEGRPYDIELRLTGESDDGGTVWLRARGEPQWGESGVVRIHGTVRDITSQKRREVRLAGENNRLQSVIENVPVALFLKDADGRYLLMNQYFRETFDVDAESVVGLTDYDIFPAEVATELRGDDRQVLETDEPVQLEEQVPTEDGPRVFLTHKVPIAGDDGTPQAVCAVAADITDHKTRQQRLERKNERLEEFASVVSHDLRNPLRVAAGRLELLAEDCDSDHIDDIENAHDRMERLIDDLLSLARQGEPATETEQLSLQTVAKAARETVETNGATIEIESDTDIVADESRLRQLVENLFHNAVEHGGDGVAVTVGDLNDDGFYIEDDGPGIDREDREQVFETGYSTSDEGTGFGLTIVREIIDAHGWELRLTESDDGGARFEIRT